MNLLERITKLALVEGLNDSQLRLDEVNSFIKEEIKPREPQLTETEISLVYDANNKLLEMYLNIEYQDQENPINGMIPKVSKSCIIYEGI